MVVIDIFDRRTEIEINVPSPDRRHRLRHDGDDQHVGTMVFFRPGLLDFVFRSVSLGGGLIVLDPTP